MAAFYDADLETARKNVGTALAAATTYGDVGGQIRTLTIIAGGLLHTTWIMHTRADDQRLI
jgi:hypothetical protein